MPSIRQNVHRARKAHRCDSCLRWILPGEKYLRSFGSSDDAYRNPPPFEMKQCKECANQYRTQVAELSQTFP